MMETAEREDRIRRYAEGPARLAAAFAKVPEEALQWRPGPGRWSVHEIVCHCADSEASGALRIRLLLAANEPTLLGYDQDAWASRLDYHAQPLEPALRVVDAVRANTVGLLRRQPAEAWRREGRHTESGRYTAEDWLTVYSEHLEKHSAQIEANLAAWRAASGK
jgi:hypothetical protein